MQTEIISSLTFESLAFINFPLIPRVGEEISFARYGVIHTAPVVRIKHKVRKDPTSEIYNYEGIELFIETTGI